MAKVLIIKNADFSGVKVATVNISSDDEAIVNVAVSPSGAGTVTGAGRYEDGEQVTLVAIADTDYTFVRWSDGITTAERTITVVGGTTVTYTALFVGQNQHVLTLSVSPSDSGTVTGAGTYVEGADVNINAVPAIGYNFSAWSDGNTNALRVIQMPSADTTLTAAFSLKERTEITENYDDVLAGFVSAPQWLTVGELVALGNTQDFPQGTYLYNIPANSIVIMEDIVSGGAYGFALCDVNGLVIETWSNSETSHTCQPQTQATKLYVSKNKLGKVYVR